MKIALFCNVSKECVIPALNVDTIYNVPKAYHEEGWTSIVIISDKQEKEQKVDLSKWDNVVDGVKNTKHQVNIAIVGKYISLLDAYKSLIEALTHGGIPNNTKAKYFLC